MKEGNSIYLETAQKLCNYFNLDIRKYFITQGKEQVLSSKTIHHHHTLLSGIFSMAVEWNLITDNPTRRVRLPSVTKSKSAPVNYYDDEQLAELLLALEDEPIKYKTILYLTIDTGLRLSEIAGLTWDSVNLEEQTIRVIRQRQHISGQGIIEKDPKSDSGVRPITMSNLVTKIMKDYKRHQSEMRLKCGSAWYQSNIVFTHDDGTPIYPNRPSSWFGDFIKRKGLPYITFHGLRHTNASLMIASGVDIVTVSGRLGHADKNVTLNTYSHVIKSREKQAANKMDQFYNEVMKSGDASNDVSNGV